MNDLMSFEEFMEGIKENIHSYLPPEYADASLNFSESRKINEQYHNLTITQEGQKVSPSINLDELYSAYQKMGDLTPVMEKIAEVALLRPDGIEIEKLENYEFAKENLFIRVCNAETNKELLETVPHKTLGDLAVTYHVMVGNDNDAVGSTIVSYNLLERYGISEEQLHMDAMENSARILSPSLEPMNKVMARMMGLGGLEVEQEPFEKAVENFNFRDESMFVLSNTRAVNGAAVIFYPEVMEQLGDNAGGNFYIIPSSVHEVILIADDGTMTRNDLEGLIKEINDNELQPKDRLSDTLYHYDSNEHRLERAVDYEERKEMESEIGRKVEKTSVRDKLKNAEARVNEQGTATRKVQAQAIE